MPLTSAAAERLAREAATGSFERTANALRIDWLVSWDRKQIQRWSEKIGAALIEQRDQEHMEFLCGHPPESPANPPELLVIGPDGGRVQFRDPDPETGHRWREDKVLAVSSYLPGNGRDVPPERLTTTYMATMGAVQEFSELCGLEALRRGLRSAKRVIALADCGTWIGTVLEHVCPDAVRIADWRHAQEYLYDAAAAWKGKGTPKAHALTEELEMHLWEGRVNEVIRTLRKGSRLKGAPRANDPQDHPRRTIARALSYFQNNHAYMNYPYYRAQGWPIGSGVTEAGVKQFNKRVKGSEQFWSEEGVETILALRANYQSQDDRWTRYWSSRPAYFKKAA